MAFCGPCARKQEVYFTIGELTHEDGRDLRSKPLAEVLERKRREREGSREGIVAEMPHGLSGVDETKALVLSCPGRANLQRLILLQRHPLGVAE